MTPIVAFLLGVFLAHRLRRRASVRGAHRAALFSLGVEIALLLAVAALPPAVPDLPIVLGIAFVAALQSSSFARVEGAAYSSVMTTGNLRRTAESLLAGFGPPRDVVAWRQGRVFAAICSTFCLGAALGAFATERLANTAALAPSAVLAVVLVVCLRGRRR